MLKKLKNNKKKGFTLVELIVVLVILAILAALLIPALTGYIDKAKNKSIIAETRQAVMAAQTVADEAYADDATVGGTGSTETAMEDADIQKVADLAELNKTNIKEIKVTAGKVTSLKYQKDKKQCVYTKSTGKYDVTNVTGDGN